jgi:hypothetical protein
LIGIDEKLYFPVRKYPENEKSDTTQEYRKLIAVILKECKLLPGSVKYAVSGILKALNIKPLGALPSKNTHIRIMLEYALLSDLFFLYRNRKEPTYLVTDDLTRIKLGRQVAVLGTKNETHLINLSALINGKTAENKTKALIDYENLLTDIVRELELRDFKEEHAKFISFIVAKVNDRFGAELSMTNMLQEIQKKRGIQPMIQLNCNSHLVNTCTEVSRMVRNHKGERWKDAGFFLKRKMIELYYNNSRLIAFLHKKTGFIYHFKKSEQESRCFKTLYFSKVYYDLVPFYRQFVKLEFDLAKSKKVPVSMDIIDMKTQLYDAEALGGLYVNMMEDIKLLQPFMNALRSVKSGVVFGGIIDQIVSEIDELTA